MRSGMEPSQDLHDPGNEKRKKRVHSIALATFLMVVGLTLSKGTGFLREIFVIQMFGGKLGTSIYSDAFYLGFQIPDLFFQLLVGGSIQAAITPTLARAIQKRDIKRGWRSISIFISVMAVVMLGTVLLGELLADKVFPMIYLSDFLSPNHKQYSTETITLATQLSKVLFPQVFFMMLAALCIGILNAYRKFSSTAFGPTFYNILVVLSIVILGGFSTQSVTNACIGITAAAGVYFLLQFVMARNEIRHFRFSLQIKDEGFRELLHLAIPTMISASIMQLNTIIISWFAGSFSEGTLTSLRNATTTWQLPYGIFAVAVGNVMLPSLSAHFAAGDDKASRSLLSSSLRNALFMTIPSTGLLFILSSDVINGIFNWGHKYSPAAVQVTATILIGYCIAVIMQTFVFIYNQAFYAIGKTRVPLINGVLTLILSPIFCNLFIGIFHGQSYAPVALSLSYSLTSTISAIVLIMLYRRNRKIAPAGILPYLVRSALCLCVMFLIVFSLNMLPIHPYAKIPQLLWLAVRTFAGIGGYLLAARVMKMEELQSFIDKLHRRKSNRTA